MYLLKNCKFIIHFISFYKNIQGKVIILKKCSAIVILLISIFFTGCSVQEKTDIEQFTLELNEIYDTEISTSDFLLGQDADNSCYLFRETENSLTALSLDGENFISGLSLLFLPEADTEEQVDYFIKICSIFTKSDYNSQKSILNSIGINSDNIKFADSNFSTTIGKYKYSIICNDYSVTLFCDRV